MLGPVLLTLINLLVLEETMTLILEEADCFHSTQFFYLNPV